MSMNMSMNMKMNPEFPIYQGIYPIPPQSIKCFNFSVFPNPSIISPFARNMSFNYQFPQMDPAYHGNPYYMHYNNFPLPPMAMYAYPMPNPNLNYVHPHQPNNNQTLKNDGETSRNKNK